MTDSWSASPPRRLLSSAAVMNAKISVVSAAETGATAVWAADESRLLIYDSTGHRTRDVTVADAPDVAGPRAA